MLNIKLVYQFNEPLFLCWTERDEETEKLKFKKIKLNPIREVYIDGVLYKKAQIREEYKIDFLKLCRKMDRYLLKKDSIFKREEELDIIKAYNTYKYKDYRLVSYQVMDKLVAIELEV